MAARRETLIFYEAPHRLEETLSALLAGLGDRPATLARERTKKFEEFRRDRLSALLASCRETPPRGEFVIVVGGAETAETDAPPVEPKDAVSVAFALIADGMAKKEAIREAARRTGLSRRDVYQAVLAAEEERHDQ